MFTLHYIPPGQAKEFLRNNAQKGKQHTKGKAAKSTKGDKQKAEIELVLKLMGVPYVTEHKFHPTRKWRFDYALTDKLIAIEYEGIYGAGKSRHTTAKGYSGDTEKYNEASKLGWKVLRYTASTYKNITDDLKDLLSNGI